MRLETVNVINTGQQALAAKALFAIPAGAKNPEQGIWLKALKANGGIIYIGPDNTGYPLNPGDAHFIPLNQLATLTLFPANGGDIIAFMII